MSEVEWVEESDWRKVEVGDRVKLKSDDLYVFTVKNVVPCSVFGGTLKDNRGHPWYRNDGWTLFVERPVIELPTEYGDYQDKNGKLFQNTYLYGWLLRDQIRTPLKLTASAIKSYLPLTRLRPVDEVRAETAKEIWSDNTGNA